MITKSCAQFQCPAVILKDCLAGSYFLYVPTPQHMDIAVLQLNSRIDHILHVKSATVSSQRETGFLTVTARMCLGNDAVRLIS